MAVYNRDNGASYVKKAVFALLLMSFACTGDRASTDQARDATTDSATVPVEHAGTTQPSPRPPETKVDTVMIEGTPQETVLRLVESPAGFEPAFYTYVPEDMTSDQVSSDEGTAWRFNARFGGVENPEAFLLVFFYPENTSEEIARERIAAMMANRRRVQRDAGEAKRYAWSIEEFSYRGTSQSGQPIVGFIALGRRNGRLFHVMIEYPAEYGDGFGPRAHRILSEWRWADGSALAS